MLGRIDWRRWGRRLLVGLAVLLVVLSFLPMWQTDRWWVRQWDYPRLQVAGVIVLVLAGLFLVKLDRARNRFSLLVALLLAALAWQSSHFIAFLPPWPPAVDKVKTCAPGRSLTLLNVNVLLTNKDYGRTIALIQRTRPDVVVLLEPGIDWANAVAPLAAQYPHRLSEAVPNTYGMIVMSRLPMTGETLYRLQAGVPSMRTHLTLRDGSVVRFDAVHPEPPWPGDDSGERDAELVSVGREVRDEGRAAVVLGDLNDVAWSRTTRLFQKVAGMNDPRVGRGFYPTFTARYPLLRWPLDHLFVSPHWQLVAIEREEDIGSDHFPILFRLCLGEDADRRLVAKEASAGTEDEASEEVREGVSEKREEDRGD